MTDSELQILIKHFHDLRISLDTPEKATDYLIKSGFLGPNGTLTEDYYSPLEILEHAIKYPERYEKGFYVKFHDNG